MQFTTAIFSLLPFLAYSVQGAATAPLPKANEYKSGDCSGPINFGHHSAFLHDVTMDGTSNSVYLAGANWIGWSGKTGNGGTCNGRAVNLPNGCVNLNYGASYRINCVSTDGIAVDEESEEK